MLWRNLLLLLLVGCRQLLGFEEPARSALDDATVVDAAVVVDAAPDAPRVWTVVETIQVNTASSSPVISMTVLAQGVEYHLRASGTARVAEGALDGDADYFDFADPKDNGCCEDFGLGIDDLNVADEMTTPDWGPYSPTHVYEIPFVGKGATITALFQDSFYSNNSGTLTLEILELK